jgi:hypothetical protein
MNSSFSIHRQSTGLIGVPPTLYHSGAWKQLLLGIPHIDQVETACAVDNGRIVAAVPYAIKRAGSGLRAVCLPLSHDVTYGFHSEPALEQLIAALPVLLGVQKIEIRSAFKPSLGPGWDAQEKNIGAITPLPATPEALWNQIGGNARTSVRVARKNGLRVEALDDLNLLFRQLCLTKRRQGVPVYPERFITRLGTLSSDGPAHLFVAFNSNGAPLASVYVAYIGTRAVYMYGASEETEESRSSNAGYLLIWEALTKAIEYGCTEFDFGSTPAHHSTLMRFKKYWKPLTWGTTYSPANLDRTGFVVRSVSTVLRHLPMPAYLAASSALFPRAI